MHAADAELVVHAAAVSKHAVRIQHGDFRCTRGTDLLGTDGLDILHHGEGHLVVAGMARHVHDGVFRPHIDSDELDPLRGKFFVQGFQLRRVALGHRAGVAIEDQRVGLDRAEVVERAGHVPEVLEFQSRYPFTDRGFRGEGEGGRA